MAANPTNILPFKTEKPTLDQAVQAWIDAKRDEDAANARRLACEALICELQPPREEGSSTHELAGGAKLTLTGKLTYRADVPRLVALCAELPVDLRPIKTETKADETGLKYLRAKHPDLWAHIAPAIEVKPAKTAVRVGF
jgi:hypothetical protein